MHKVKREEDVAVVRSGRAGGSFQWLNRESLLAVVCGLWLVFFEWGCPAGTEAFPLMLFGPPARRAAEGAC